MTIISKIFNYFFLHILHPKNVLIIQQNYRYQLIFAFLTVFGFLSGANSLCTMFVLEILAKFWKCWQYYADILHIPIVFEITETLIHLQFFSSFLRFLLSHVADFWGQPLNNYLPHLNCFDQNFIWNLIFIFFHQREFSPFNSSHAFGFNFWLIAYPLMSKTTKSIILVVIFFYISTSYCCCRRSESLSFKMENTDTSN